MNRANVDFAFSLKSQVADTEGMGGKLSGDDKSTILAAVKEATEWLDENPSAEAEDYEDKLSELQSKVAVSIVLSARGRADKQPITSKLYSGGGGGGDEQMPFGSHDEL